MFSYAPDDVCNPECGMTRPSETEPIARGADMRDRSERFGDRRRQSYEPPQVEVFGKLESVVRFGGSNAVDSGGGFGNQPGPPVPNSRSRD